MTKIYIVIPSYNEAPMLPHTILALQKEGYKNIIVVDDGSTDNTEQVLKKFKSIYYIRHSINRGQGASIKTGLEAANILHTDIAVTFDADSQHNPKDIKTLTKTLQKGYDFVLGYRKLNSMPQSKRVANILANLVTKILYGIDVKDSQCGLRAYSKKAIDSLDTSSDRYDFASEVLRVATRHKLRLSEVPVTVYYTEYSKSKKDKQNMVNAIKTLYRMILSS